MRPPPVNVTLARDIVRGHSKLQPCTCIGQKAAISGLSVAPFHCLWGDCLLWPVELLHANCCLWKVITFSFTNLEKPGRAFSPVHPHGATLGNFTGNFRGPHSQSQDTGAGSWGCYWRCYLSFCLTQAVVTCVSDWLAIKQKFLQPPPAVQLTF